MALILCPSCFQGHILFDDNDGHVKCDGCGVQFIQTGPTSVRFATESDWIPCGKAHLQSANAEYQKEMLEQSKKDESDRFMDNWGCH
jgi:hypothetical protein